MAPRVALTWLTPPGRKRSKGIWALVGARGVIIGRTGALIDGKRMAIYLGKTKLISHPLEPDRLGAW
jgi:hypothetical protein